jgi:hypothetical protein
MQWRDDSTLWAKERTTLLRCEVWSRADYLLGTLSFAFQKNSRVDVLQFPLPGKYAGTALELYSSRLQSTPSGLAAVAEAPRPRKWGLQHDLRRFGNDTIIGDCSVNTAIKSRARNRR